MSYSKRSKKVSKIFLGFFVTTFFWPLAQAQSLIESSTEVSAELRLIPTSLVIEPAEKTLKETDGTFQFKAYAIFDYDGMTCTGDPYVAGVTPCRRDVTADLTEWSSALPEVAWITSTTGLVTPVSDLNVGAQKTKITAVYGGKTATADLTVTGVVVTPPPATGGSSGGGGGGGASIGYSPSGLESFPMSGQVNWPPKGSEEEVVENPEGNVPGETTESSQQGTSGNEGNVTSGSGESDKGQGSGVRDPGGRPVETSEDSGERSPYLPVENTSKIEKVRVKEEPAKQGEVTRSIVAAQIAKKLNIFGLRKNLLNRCYQDLENCTNIFRMYSSYKDIKLDPKDLRLFPDLEEDANKDTINKLALLGVVSGYYGNENSPFLPNNKISKVEALKIMTTVVSTLEKSKSNYVAPKFDYNSLFYQQIYAASLLSESVQSAAKGQALLNWGLMERAFALTEQEWKMIRNQKTAFADVRPDLYNSHWYYPIVFRKVCEMRILPCKGGDLVEPDKNPSVAEVDALLNKFEKYLSTQKINASAEEDSDKDGILNLDENSIYYTNPKNADTDGDGLTDGQEVFDLKTNPKIADTDGDGLKDGEEVKLKTNPLVKDTDGDGFSDKTEIDAKSDPLKASSIPVDKNDNQVSDVWETDYGIEVATGSQDTDSDGLSDVVEFQRGSNPVKIDSDMDGLTDAEEILNIQSDPNDKLSPGDFLNLPVVINNFQFNQIVSDPSPLIKGVGPVSKGDNEVKIQILLRNEFGSEMVLGETQTDAKGNFVFTPQIAIKNGTYLLLARSINQAEVKLSDPLKITIDNNAEVGQVIPEKMESSPITEDVLLNDLLLKVDSADGQPVLSGKVNELGSTVNVTWQSMVVSSALIADITDGTFSVKAPKLTEGRHTVYIQAVRKSDNAMSKTIKINFYLSKVGGVVDGSLSASASKLSTLDMITKQNASLWISLIIIMVVGGGSLYLYMGKDEDENNDEEIKKK